MKPHEVKLPLRLGPYEFNMWAEGFRRRGINIYEAFEIERRPVPGRYCSFTEYIIKGVKPVVEERKEER